MTELKITPVDPVVVRDGRPFGQFPNTRMRTTDWIYPSVVAGTVRTLIGKMMHEGNGWFTEDIIGQLTQLWIGGPFPVTHSSTMASEIMLPRPLDIVVSGDDRPTLHARRPRAMENGTGCDLPHPQLLPVFAGTQMKPQTTPEFWPVSAVAEWASKDLFGKRIDWDEWASAKRISPDFPLKETRTHVRIQADTLTAADGELFTTTGIDLRDRELSIRVDADTHGRFAELLDRLDEHHSLGGERRLAHFDVATTTRWAVPATVLHGLSGAHGVRMTLATPALFAGGWLPGWLQSDSLEGEPPGASGLKLKLIGACTERWKPISGWDLKTKRQKPLRRLVPAGSVYFFRVLAGDPGAYVSDLWLQSVADEAQDRRDGFGLATFGVWNTENVG